MRILITGAASGIGYELGKKLSKRRHTVYLTTHTTKQLLRLKEKIKRDNINVLCFKMDIETDDINLVDKIKLDCLVNHAGIGIGGSILYMNIDNLKKNYDVNIFASFKLLQKVYKNMERDNINGKIFVTSSLAGSLPIPFLGCYTSSKAAISILTRTINEELKYLKSRISITLIEPGAYNTGFNKVMIENKEKYMNSDNKIYDNLESINKIQKNMFSLLESNNYSSLINKIIKNIESPKPKFLIREPISQKIFTKLYKIFH